MNTKADLFDHYMSAIADDNHGCIEWVFSEISEEEVEIFYELGKWTTTVCESISTGFSIGFYTKEQMDLLFGAVTDVAFNLLRIRPDDGEWDDMIIPTLNEKYREFALESFGGPSLEVRSSLH